MAVRSVSHRKGSRLLSPRAQMVGSFVQLLIGTLIIAVSFNMFMVPNGIASGGVSGASILIQRLTNIAPAYTQWALNIPLFLAGLWLLGRKFAIHTLLGSILLPLFVLLTDTLPSPTDSPLLAAIYGGIGVGLGIGLVFRGGGSTGGTDLAAQILHRYTGLPLSWAIVLFDGCVIVAAGFIISPEVALYAMIALFVTSKTIDIVQSGLQLSKVAFIISDKSDHVADAILHDLDRGLTRLDGQGGYTGESRTVLMVVVNQNEVLRLKQLVQTIDSQLLLSLAALRKCSAEDLRLEIPNLSPLYYYE